MTQVLLELLLFSAKSFIIVLMIIVILIAFFALLVKGKEKKAGKLKIKNLNKQYDENKEIIFNEIFSKKQLKDYHKKKKADDKSLEKKLNKNHVYVLQFQGDIKANAVASLSEEITAILNVATPKDEVVLRLESPGGVVPGYGLAAAQLIRLKMKNIPLTIAIDKVAASGGYLMAAVANKIIAAPFAIIGSIGVIVQLPNFNRLLKEKNIDFEQLTAGEYKRTLSVFGENTEQGREKLKEEIEAIHSQFKNLVTTHRPKLEIQKVATGEIWLGQEALNLNLVDELKTSDDYLLQLSEKATLLEISYETKKSFFTRFMSRD